MYSAFDDGRSTLVSSNVTVLSRQVENQKMLSARAQQSALAFNRPRNTRTQAATISCIHAPKTEETEFSLQVAFEDAQMPKTATLNTKKKPSRPAWNRSTLVGPNREAQLQRATLGESAPVILSRKNDFLDIAVLRFQEQSRSCACRLS